MRFRILGPFEVVGREGRELALGGRKQRAVLAILVLHANQPVSIDRLSEELWAGRPPPSARKVLHTYVSKLRVALGDQVLVTRAAGYELHVERDQLDVDRFQDLVAGSRSLPPPDAAQVLRDALALWRGPALADFMYEAFAQREIARLEELRVVALEERIEADLRCGRHSELVSELEALVAEHPLRERLRSQLMLACYRAGRQAEALAVYRDGRRALVDELGIEPGPRLQEFERAILRHDPSLELASAPTASAPDVSRALALPSRSTSFVGRARELAEIDGLLRDPDVRLLTLTGPGGAGKTRLALEAAERLRARFRDGILFVDLSPVRDPELVSAAVAESAGLREPRGAAAKDELTSHLAGKDLLLLLDNFEQVLTAAPTLEELLHAAPGPTMLLTSRTPLQVAFEHLYPVPPLALPQPQEAPSAIESVEAVALFVDRARAARADFALTGANAASVGELCVRLDGLPLALELAAARVALLSPRAILARVGRWLDLLKRATPDIPERHRTLRAAIEWSYELLRPEEQALFARLGVFVGGFTIDGAEAVAAQTSVDVVDGVDGLLRANLARAEGAAGDEPRFGMLEIVREYALERVAQRGEARELRDRHARFYLALAERTEPELRGPDQVRWLELLDAEKDNLRLALSWAAEGGDADCGLRTGAALWRFWQVRGHAGEGRRQLERLLAGRAGSARARAAAQLTVGRCAFLDGDFETLEWSVAASGPVHRKLGDAHSLAFALFILGAAKAAQGDDQAFELLAEALTVARAAGDRWCESMATAYRGGALLASGDLTGARHSLEEALRGARECGDARAVCAMLIALARVALVSGDSERARGRLSQALAACRTVGDLWGIATALEMLGSIALDDGDEREATLLLAESLRTAWMARGRPELVAAMQSLARLSLVRGDPVRAARLYASAGVLAERVRPYPMFGRRPEPVTYVAQVEATLTGDTFAEAWAQGRAMTLDEAVSYALEEEPAVGLAATGPERDACADDANHAFP
jgi:predicted ATPase/DNA-binding SARP family transcriptional activator